jgi:hypothetical protein
MKRGASPPLRVSEKTPSRHLVNSDTPQQQPPLVSNCLLSIVWQNKRDNRIVDPWCDRELRGGNYAAHHFEADGDSCRDGSDGTGDGRTDLRSGIAAK